LPNLNMPGRKPAGSLSSSSNLGSRILTRCIALVLELFAGDEHELERGVKSRSLLGGECLVVREWLEVVCDPAEYGAGDSEPAVGAVEVDGRWG
jgi:hypothetical protein